MTTQLLMLIAIWCGDSTSCRKEKLECIEGASKPLAYNGQVVMQAQASEAEVIACLTKELRPKKKAKAEE